MLSQPQIRELLAQVASGKLDVEQALSALRAMPFEDLGFANLDHHRDLRKGFPEVVYCAGKTAEQVAQIVAKLAQRGPRVLATRATAAQFEAAAALVPGLQFDAVARVIWLDNQADQPRMEGVAVVAAGTSDLPVAQEAARTLELLGQAPQRLYDVGVAGLHRLLHHLSALQEAKVIVVVAGMEGALPSVVGGLVRAPVIAVPTSVGYGASFGGIAALLSMLNSCVPGIAVVNIDNGFGAGYMAGMINRSIVEGACGGDSRAKAK
jgi:pyridinium-3,5-biscarboxylic acid mononucleotide synthase